MGGEIVAIMNQSRSPVNWIGGKHYSARHIIEQFPVPTAYDTYCELFGGGAHVFMQKKAYNHVEVYNDINGDLVNFWLQCRDHGETLETRCRSLPYSREVYYQYHASLFDGTELEPLERAVRWFYVLRANFSGKPLKATADGWNGSVADPHHCSAHAYHSAVDLLKQVQKRFQRVMIDNRDFEKVFKQYEKPRALYYLDPPYLDNEHYYHQAFILEDHKRLASLLNSTSAYVALSYYPHPVVDELYPAAKWRRLTWETPKHSQKTKEKRDYGTELLLLNYPSAAKTLFDFEEAV